MIRRVAKRRRRPRRTAFVGVAVIASVVALLAPVSAAVSSSSAAAATAPAGGYVSVPWARVLDTTTGLGAPKTPVAANGSVTFAVAGHGGVPATGAGSVVLNVTAKLSRQPGGLTVYPAGVPKPAGANLSFATGATVSNLVTVALGTAGSVTVTNGSAGVTAVTADVVGYFAAGSPSAAGTFGVLASARVLDTTTGLGAPLAPVAANGVVSFTVAGHGGIPASGVGSVVLNVTAKASKAAGNLTAYPAGAAKPSGANLGFALGATVSNLVTVALGTAGQVTIANGSTGTTAVTADVLGYFLSGTPAVAGAFTTVPSARVLDTAAGVGSPATPIVAHGTITATIAGSGGVPASGVAAVVLNVTAKNATATGAVKVYAAGATKPAGAYLTFPVTGSISELAVVALSSGGKISINSTSTGTVDVTADVLGYIVSGADSSPPAAVTAPKAVGAPNSVTLSWTNPTDADFTGVMVRRAVGTTAPASPTAGTLVSDVSAPAATVTDSGLAANTKYSYAFFSHDAVPNFSSAVNLTYSVPAAPTVTLLSANSGAAAGGTVVTITGTNFTGASACTFGAAPAAFTVTDRHQHHRHVARRHRHRRRHRHHRCRHQYDRVRRTGSPTRRPAAAAAHAPVTGLSPTSADRRRHGGHHHRHQPHRRDRRQLRRDDGTFHRHQRHHDRRDSPRRHRHRRRHRHHHGGTSYDERERPVHLRHSAAATGPDRDELQPGSGPSTGAPSSRSPARTSPARPQ